MNHVGFMASHALRMLVINSTWFVFYWGKGCLVFSAGAGAGTMPHMLTVIRNDGGVMILKDGALQQRVAAFVLCLVGLLFAFHSVSQLPDGNEFFGGVIIACIGAAVFLFNKSHVVSFDKTSDTIEWTETSLLKTGSRQRFPLGNAVSVHLRMTFQQHSAPARILYVNLREEDPVCLNLNDAPLLRVGASYRRSCEVGRAVADFLGVPFAEKKFNED